MVSEQRSNKMIFTLAEKIQKMLDSGAEYAQCPGEHGCITIKRYQDMMEIQLVIRDAKVMGVSPDKYNITKVDGITITDEEGENDAY